MVDSKSINFRYAFIAVYILGFLARNFTANNNYSGQDWRNIALINTYVDDWWFFLTLDLAFFIPIFFFDRRRTVGVLRGREAELSPSALLPVLFWVYFCRPTIWGTYHLRARRCQFWIRPHGLRHRSLHILWWYLLAAMSAAQTRSHSDNMLRVHAIS
ncbi:MAG: hypothetical protein EP340_04130 [Alphaproteobacteria bacterium]|nr:MAG: hypothetical protein EP340_04130 [Alphaproteobacteria bacterium]